MAPLGIELAVRTMFFDHEGANRVYAERTGQQGLSNQERRKGAVSHVIERMRALGSLQDPQDMIPGEEIAIQQQTESKE